MESGSCEELEIPGGEGDGTPLQYYCWKIPWMEEPGGLKSMGSRRVGHDWTTLLSLFTFMHWRRKWQPTPLFLPGESQGRGSLVGWHVWGHRAGHDWSDLAAAAAEIPGMRNNWSKGKWKKSSNWFIWGTHYGKELGLDNLVSLQNGFKEGNKVLIWSLV